jgi:hypothetical protein
MNTLLIDPQIIKDTSRVDNNIGDKLLRNTLINVQETRLQNLIGTSLYKKLTDNDPNDLTTEYKDLIIEYIQNVLIYGTISKLMRNSYYKISTSGIIRQEGDNFTPLSFKETNSLKKDIDYDLHNYSKYLTEFLTYNADTYPEFNENVLVGENATSSKIVSNIYISPASKNRRNNSAIF